MSKNRCLFYNRAFSTIKQYLSFERKIRPTLIYFELYRFQLVQLTIYYLFKKQKKRTLMRCK